MSQDNPFFRIAMNQAWRLAGKPGRIAGILTQLAMRFRNVRKEDLTLSTIRVKLGLVSRMVKAHLGGSYKIRSLKLFMMLLAVILYFLNPFDLIPDFIIGIGLTDDLAVLTWIYSAAQQEVNSFAEWENSQAATPVTI